MSAKIVQIIKAGLLVVPLIFSPRSHTITLGHMKRISLVYLNSLRVELLGKQMQTPEEMGSFCSVWVSTIQSLCSFLFFSF